MLITLYLRFDISLLLFYPNPLFYPALSGKEACFNRVWIVEKSMGRLSKREKEEATRRERKRAQQKAEQQLRNLLRVEDQRAGIPTSTTTAKGMVLPPAI